MNDVVLVALPVLGATLVLSSLAWRLHVVGQRRLDALERRLEEAAFERVATLATTLGEELGAQRRSNEALSDALVRLGRDVERLGADVLNRELYRGGEKPRHGDAIDAIRHGGDVASLMREHGLPLEEAELLVSLYADAGTAARVDGGSGERARTADDPRLEEAL